MNREKIKKWMNDLFIVDLDYFIDRKIAYPDELVEAIRNDEHLDVILDIYEKKYPNVRRFDLIQEPPNIKLWLLILVSEYIEDIRIDYK